jgi:hypothetical protein
MIYSPDLARDAGLGSKNTRSVVVAPHPKAALLVYAAKVDAWIIGGPIANLHSPLLKPLCLHVPLSCELEIMDVDVFCLTFSRGFVKQKSAIPLLQRLKK